MQLIKTYEGEIINLENATRVYYDEEFDRTTACFVGGGSVILSHGNALTLLWTGRRDFTEVNYGA